jgi:hypothetical protein
VTSRPAEPALVVAGTAIIGILLGALMGVVWWWVAPTEEWTVVKAGVVLPADVGYNAWFGADGWFLVLGAIAGVLLTLIVWWRGRRQPVALVVGVIIGAGLLAVSAWTLGGVLGPPDPKVVAETAEPGTTVDGALGLRALGVLCAPALTALTLLALFVASARVEEAGTEPASPAEGSWVPQQSW